MKFTLAAACLLAAAIAGTCDHDESTNKYGPNMCDYNRGFQPNPECQGNRYCDGFNWCMGNSGCKHPKPGNKPRCTSPFMGPPECVRGHDDLLVLTASCSYDEA